MQECLPTIDFLAKVERLSFLQIPIQIPIQIQIHMQMYYWAMQECLPTMDFLAKVGRLCFLQMSSRSGNLVLKLEAKIFWSEKQNQPTDVCFQHDAGALTEPGGNSESERCQSFVECVIPYFLLNCNPILSV